MNEGINGNGKGSHRVALAALAVAAVLAACGGGSIDGASAGAAGAPRKSAQAAALNPAGWVAVTQPNDPLMQNLNIPADAPTRGMWSAAQAWPLNGLHQAVLPDGKVLTWGNEAGDRPGRGIDIWDPARGLADAGSHLYSYDATRQDSFCAPSVFVADGRLMITGGNTTTTSQYFSPATGGMTRGPNVADDRWYATMVTLPDGRTMIVGGINGGTEGQWQNPDQSVAQGLSSMTPEIMENGAWRTLVNAQSRTAFGPDFLRASLPKAWTAPDGRVFGIGSDQMYYVDPNGNGGSGSITIVGQYKAPPTANATNDTALNVGPSLSAVMFAPGRILTVGGNAYHNGIGYPASRKATLVDINGGGAAMTEQPAMAFPRNYASTIVLPDGKVLVTGGETRANNDATLGVFAAEMWNPATGSWTTGASASVFRAYHSQTSLLPNGTVLSSGGGQPGPIQLWGEVFYPPYLFRTVNGAAQLAPRPQLVGISGLKHNHGAQMQFDLSNNGTVSQVALIGLSVGTHSFNAGQRRVPLTFTQDNFRITATMPGANLAPPGYYQLIALDANGVPSRGTIVALGASIAAPAVATSAYTPPDTGSVAPPPPPSGTTPPADAIACAPHNGVCTLPAGATATVWYGVDTRWVFKTGVTGSIGCNDATFGDPAVGVPKTCSYVLAGSTPSTGTGTGLTGQYFASNDLSGAAVLSRTEAPWFDWGTGSPAANVPADNFSVRWSGEIQAVEAGGYQFRTVSDDGVRVRVNGTLVIDNWTAHAPTTDTSGVVTLAAGQRVPIVVEFQEFGGGAVLQLSWLRPGGAWAAVPATQLYASGVTPGPITAPVFNAPLITAGGTASYTVAATAGVAYSWDFGDGSPATAFSATASTTKVFANPGVYGVTLTAKAADGSTATRTVLQAVGGTPTAQKPTASAAVALETRAGASARLWAANPDTDTVAVIDTATNARDAEIAVGGSPRSVAIAPDGRVWVVNKGSASISIVSPATLAVVQTVALPFASQPHGLAFAPGGSAFVVLEATGQLLKLDPASGATQATLAVGANPRHVSATANGALVLVSRFITNPLPGESTAAVDTTTAGAEVVAVNAGAMTLNKTIVLRHSDKIDNEIQGAGIPNYLAAAVISPDGARAWVPSKQDNIKRGTLRNTQPLNFQNTVRAISSRIDMSTLAEDYAARVDHDNSSLGSAAAYHPSGAYLFVTLETSRQVAIVDPVGARELLKVDVGRAPQAVAVSADGTRLYVQNFMDRSVSVLDLGPLVNQGQLAAPVLATVGTVGTERLTAQVLLGKQLFYDARDTRLARDSYMSCASCHSDAGHDGRTWDFTGFGEGLRNTPALKGRAGIGQGFVHWSANFDEIQDFEGQIRNFAGGTGLMTDAAFNTGTRNTPLGDRKAGVSADLDALAAYLGSLTAFDRSPLRNADGTLTAAAVAGKTVFTNANCASCHGGAGFTGSGGASTLKNVGTIKPTSGQRLGAALTGIDVPTLRDVWKTGPYLHDGSAPTLAAAVQAHTGVTVATADVPNLVAYLQQIGSDEPGPTPPTPANQPPTVSLTAPANNASVVQGTAIAISANAADPDGTVARVEFYDGGTLLGTSTAAPFGFGWTNAPVGAHTITARAFDNAGASTTSAAVTITVTAASTGGTGTGLAGSYYGNPVLGGAVLLARIEAPWFDWGTGSPGPGIGVDNFSVRWTGQVEAVEAGAYQFRTNSDDGVRVWINGVLVINNWTAHAPTLDTSAVINLAAGQRVPIVIEYQEYGGGAVMQLSWLRPGGAWAPVPAGRLYP